MSQVPSLLNLCDALLEGSATILPAVPNVGVKLAAGTFYFPVGSTNDPTLKAIEVYWDLNFAGTFTLETCNFDGANGQATDVTNSEASSLARWVQENPTTAYVAIDAVNTALGVGSKIIWTALTGVVTAGVVGSAMVHVGNLGSKRIRLKVVCVTGGALRVAHHGKD